MKINLTSISGNPCLSMDLDNVTLFCDNEIIGTNTETFMTITNIKNSEIKNCKISNILQGILINAFTLTDNAINNKFTIGRAHV